ncbi:MAG: calcium/sodium antiporter [Burkholderiaceae bacterium]|nr:calcium/sodium antiporter [Rhodoferax sp.]MCP5284056.1 calcium/sodium antiporter [Burkholderiaceae bacterium]
MDALLFAGGLVALVAGAELLVRGASRLALSFGISPLVVGLTIVAFGTSAPEMTVSVGAVINGQSGLALGNAVGSNVFNVLFILGLAAIIAPLAVNLQLIRQEVPIMIGAALLVMVVSLDGRIGGFDATLLFGLLLLYTVFLVRQSRRQGAQTGDYGTGPVPATSSRLVNTVLLVAGLALLAGGSEAMVRAAVSFARSFGVSEVMIGLTIVAVGTSLPEVAASVAAAIRGERDIAVGNVVGSCVFNLLGVIGLGGLAAALTGAGGLPVPASVMHFDLWVMLAALVACLPIFITGREVARWEGALFLAYYVAYMTYQVLQARQSPELQAFNGTMLGFVLPLTVVTVVVTTLRGQARR